MSGRTETQRFRIARKSVPAARHHVEELLREWKLGDLVEVASLITSELTANVVKHAKGIGEFFEVGVRRRTGVLILEVTDSYSWSMPELKCPAPCTELEPDAPAYDPEFPIEDVDENGRGLELVVLLAEKWGVRPRKSGKAVWVHLSIQCKATS